MPPANSILTLVLLTAAVNSSVAPLPTVMVPLPVMAATLCVTPAPPRVRLALVPRAKVPLTASCALKVWVLPLRLSVAPLATVTAVFEANVLAAAAFSVSVPALTVVVPV